MTSNSVLPNWSLAHGGPIFRGRIRQSTDDFAVTEVLGFEPSGDGEHDYLWIEKKNTNTAWLARRLADFAGVPVRDVGYAGMKDRSAVTRQWFSVRRPGGTPATWSALDVDGVEVLANARNARKLRRGAHVGNRFRIVVRDIGAIRAEPDQTLFEQQVQAVAGQGVPNYFGEQRFGRDAGNLQLATAFFAGKRLKREQRSIALSSARAWIFNHVVQRRVQDGQWAALQLGDTAVLDGSNSIFPVTELDEELLRRCQNLDLHPSGPLWGEGGKPLPLENEVAALFPELMTGLEKHTKSSRRALRLAVRDLQASVDGDHITLEFYLARGGFATAVLRELLEYE